jgi:hypothetical protein
MFNVTGHTMVARGYIRYLVSYKETTGPFWNRKTVTIFEHVDYIIVNHGYSTTYYGEYGYFPASKTTNANLLYNAQLINE